LAETILWALLIEYDGGGFAGWQRQGNLPTVQAVLEQAAGKLCGVARIACTAAGRTDAGVHAAGQVVQLSLPDRFSAERVRDALNFHMKPHPVVVLQAAPAPPGWHARFSAIGRRYLFRISDRRARAALARGRVWHIAHRLDVAAMHAAARVLVGRHDFTSFRATACQAKSPIRTLDRLDVARVGEEIEVVAEARSFLHHQVRNMVGTLALVGAGRWEIEAVKTALEALDRRAAGPTAPPEGLYLMEVCYEGSLLNG